MIVGVHFWLEWTILPVLAEWSTIPCSEWRRAGASTRYTYSIAFPGLSCFTWRGMASLVRRRGIERAANHRISISSSEEWGCTADLEVATVPSPGELLPPSCACLEECLWPSCQLWREQSPWSPSRQKDVCSMGSARHTAHAMWSRRHIINAPSCVRCEEAP